MQDKIQRGKLLLGLQNWLEIKTFRHVSVVHYCHPNMWQNWSNFLQVQSCSQGKYTGSFSGGQVSNIFIISYLGGEVRIMVFVISRPSIKMSSSEAFMIFIGESNLYSKTVFDCCPNIEEEFLQINRELGGRHLTEVFPFIRSDRSKMNWILWLFKIDW